MYTGKETAQFAKIETPFYYYDLNFLIRTLKDCADAAKACNFHIHYALKANFNDRILEQIRDIGFGADCVSGGEVKKAADTGFEKNRIVFAGVGKSDKEILDALDLGIYCFNVESVQEIGIIDGLAGARSTRARVAIRINPNVDAHTHANITTGLDENKFGINSWDLDACAAALKSAANIDFLGIHFHIGSQITEMEVFRNLCIKVNEFAGWFTGKGFQVKVLNVGGGLGIDYRNPDNQIPDFKSYFKIFADFLEIKPGQEVHFELGRALVGQCASLISRVLYVKTGRKKNFVILDAGMTELMRPALYQAYHKIENLTRSQLPTPNSQLSTYDVVGPICESTDCFGKEVALPESARGDLFAIRSTGAYGEVLSSGYNLRERVRSVYSTDFDK